MTTRTTLLADSKHHSLTPGHATSLNFSNTPLSPLSIIPILLCNLIALNIYIYIYISYSSPAFSAFSSPFSPFSTDLVTNPLNVTMHLLSLHSNRNHHMMATYLLYLLLLTLYFYPPPQQQ